MKSLICLVEEFLLDSLSTTPVPLHSCRRDINRLRERVKHEGDSFLKLTLPDFGKIVLRSIETGTLETEQFKYKFKCLPSGFPVLFQGYLQEMFDTKTKLVRSDLNIECLRVIRQVCALCSKIKCAPTNKQEYIAERAFVECDTTLRAVDPLNHPDHNLIRAVGRALWASVLDDYIEYKETMVFRHGPGAVSDPRVKGSKKFDTYSFDSELDARFQFADTMFANYNHWATWVRANALQHTTPMSTSVVLGRADLIDFIDDNEPYLQTSTPVRVVFVPKTCKGPRTIAIEPVHMQFVQQGIKDYLYGKLESHVCTAGHINFVDQTLNQRLAHESSITRAFCTMDLSEASDRVSLEWVKEIFSSCPDFLADILACRSKQAKLPSGRVLPLAKFASMGSALCFPIEAMVFYTMLIASALRLEGKSATLTNIKSVSKDLFVYGDDIICRSAYAGSAIRCLENAGLKVNLSKTFRDSHFRESCGKEYYKGIDITPIYLRIDMFSTKCNRTDDPMCISTYWAFRNSMYQLGYWRLTKKLDDAYCADNILPSFKIRRLLVTYQDTSAFIGRRSYLGYEVHRFDKQYHAFRSRGYVVKNIKSKAIDGYSALLRWFCTWSPNNDQSQTTEVLRGAVTIAYRK